MRQDVELKCDNCGSETLATEGMYEEKCRHCKIGKRLITKEHGKILNWEETKQAGYIIR